MPLCERSQGGRGKLISMQAEKGGGLTNSKTCAVEPVLHCWDLKELRSHVNAALSVACLAHGGQSQT